MTDLNWLAVVAAALCSFLLGGPWYSPALFGRIWARETTTPARRAAATRRRCSA